MCLLRKSSQSNRGEKVDGKASVSGIIARKETFIERLQGPETQTQIKQDFKFVSVRLKPFPSLGY